MQSVADGICPSGAVKGGIFWAMSTFKKLQKTSKYLEIPSSPPPDVLRDVSNEPRRSKENRGPEKLHGWPSHSSPLGSRHLFGAKSFDP